MRNLQAEKDEKYRVVKKNKNKRRKTGRTKN